MGNCGNRGAAGSNPALEIFGLFFASPANKANSEFSDLADHCYVCEELRAEQTTAYLAALLIAYRSESAQLPKEVTQQLQRSRLRVYVWGAGEYTGQNDQGRLECFGIIRLNT